MMVCTFGDQEDAEKYKAHRLPLRKLIAPDGKLTSIAGKYKGMKIKQAREEIVKDLEKQGFLKAKKKIEHVVNVHERCGTEIEILPYNQWFIKYLDLKKDLLKWGKEIKWYPNYMRHRYDNWVKGLKWDWCISRQIPFGVSFPIWYCEECGEVILAKEKDLPVHPLEDKPPVKECPKCKSKKFIPEKDIMNTWFTSSMTPTIVKNLVKKTKAYNKIKDEPLSIRRNGHDIITFWDFNTILKSFLHYNYPPWKELFINGWMLDPKGKN
ncbi:MAG: class I tRNA ligase family protein [Nanoarchaeota archaeon]